MSQHRCGTQLTVGPQGPFNLLTLDGPCVRSVRLVPQITHSLLMKSDRKLVPALRLLRCRSADIRLCPLHIRLASKSLRKISCRRGRNIRAGTCSPPCGQGYKNSRLAWDLIQTATPICGQNWFIMAESCLPFRMAPSNPWMYWTARSRRRRARNQAGLASDVRFAAGRRARTTCGLVAAGMGGIRSIPEECAPPAFTSGPQPNACHVAAGRRIAIGICIDISG